MLALCVMQSMTDYNFVSVKCYLFLFPMLVDYRFVQTIKVN